MPSQKFFVSPGDVYGSWTIMSYSKEFHKWNCLCICGTSRLLLAASLVNGTTKSCGCIRAKKNNLTGQVFGRLTAISLHRELGRSGKWECICQCGKTTYVTTDQLRSGKTKSCGCLMVEGSIKVINKVNASGIMLGEGNPAWKGGITPLKKLIRECPEYYKWRSLVFERDNYSCQVCQDSRGGNLHAHHIKLFADILEEFSIQGLEEAKSCLPLWDIDNGVTLCKLCHELVHSSYFHTIC